jgi:hypothetical protein
MTVSARQLLACSRLPAYSSSSMSSCVLGIQAMLDSVTVLALSANQVLSSACSKGGLLVAEVVFCPREHPLSSC